MRTGVGGVGRQEIEECLTTIARPGLCPKEEIVMTKQYMEHVKPFESVLAFIFEPLVRLTQPEVHLRVFCR